MNICFAEIQMASGSTVVNYQVDIISILESLASQNCEMLSATSRHM
jgi:hypothetical protein